jgi:beta-lactamase superfamily II metal-dependent hydrolase
MSDERMTAKKNTIKVRMYNTRFGDCFLLAFPVGNNKFKYVLIDCGIHHSTSGKKDIMKKVARSIKKATNSHIHLLVVTHEHTDHIEGFKSANDIFNGFTIDNVWMGWTENYADPRVRDLDKKFKLYLEALKIAKNKLKHQNKAFADKLDGLLGFYAEDMGADGKILSLTNRNTMIWLKEKAKKLKYCSPGGKPLQVKGLTGVRFFVLGPPTQKDLLKEKGVSSSEYKAETYLTDPGNDFLDDFVREVLKESKSKSLGLDEAGGILQHDRNPFDERFHIKKNETYRSEFEQFFQKMYTDKKNDWRQIDDKWLELSGELAIKMNSHTNNSSLALAIELGKKGKVLLFPGDAEVGNWLGWEDLTWEVDGKAITNDDLLKRTVLYKVGHHSSHNATLSQKGLERMTDKELSALIPVNEEFADKKGWPIPHPTLLSRLIEKCKNRVLRSDEAIPVEGDKPYNLSKEKWNNFLCRVTEDDKDDLYIDLTLEV